MKNIRILTNIDANHGSCIFNVTLSKILEDILPNQDIKFLNSIPLKMRLYEILRLFKPNKKIPHYNLFRYNNLMRYSKKYLKIEDISTNNSYDKMIEMLLDHKYDSLIVGKVIWDIANVWQVPKFPNIFWLSEKLPSKKIAYAASGHRTELSIFRQHKEDIYRILSSYNLISVRDDMTYEMMTEANVYKEVPVYKICDPAFLFQPRSIDLNELCDKFGINLSHPILGLLYYGKHELSEALVKTYKNRGYQIINFNMYNPYADINIGHLVDPDEWAALYSALSFCITDRFHCSVFCLRNNVPFIGIEPYSPNAQLNSKIFNILKDFDLVDPCYFNQYDNNVQFSELIDRCENIEVNWKKSFSEKVENNLAEQINEQKKFILEVQRILE